MKTVIFAGGLGTRLSEETTKRPKPMVEIGGKPILWHIMKIYEHYGFNEFVICLGYKGYMIKEYFINYFLHNADVTVDLGINAINIHRTKSESFKVTLVDTGLMTMTAGRLKRVEEHLKGSRFMLTYGDGVSNVDIKSLIDFHESHGKIATMTAIQPPARFGNLEINENQLVSKFVEKPKTEGGWINGGFFVLEPEVFDFLPDDSDDIMWEDLPLRTLADKGELMSHKHRDFWKCMDHLRDKIALDDMWTKGDAKWKTW